MEGQRQFEEMCLAGECAAAEQCSCAHFHDGVCVKCLETGQPPRGEPEQLQAR